LQTLAEANFLKL